MKNPKSILITGASSGIGKALAIEYAAPGIALFLSGRSIERLDHVQKQCNALGATVSSEIIDCRDKDAMQSWIDKCDEIMPLDLVIANAGVSSSVRADDDLAGHTASVFETNVGGVFNTVHPAIDCMKRRSRGQIAIVSSMAGMRGLPSSPAYSTSKVAVRAYGEALRGFYHHKGIEISVICPGFVKSSITDQNHFKMPFLMEADKAARIIRRGLKRNKPTIIFPWQMKIAAFLVRRVIPEFLLERMLRKLPQK